MTSLFRAVFPNTTRPLVAMAHVPALPGTPLYDAAGGVDALVEHVQRDVDVLVEAGFDAVMFCNENDRPYELHAGPEASAVMARVVTECRPAAIPFGVDFLWDPRIALAAAQDAASRGETPVGAVIVDPATEEVIAVGANGPIGAHDPTAHAEIVALRAAAAASGSTRWCST